MASPTGVNNPLPSAELAQVTQRLELLVNEFTVCCQQAVSRANDIGEIKAKIVKGLSNGLYSQ